MILDILTPFLQAVSNERSSRSFKKNFLFAAVQYVMYLKGLTLMCDLMKNACFVSYVSIGRQGFSPKSSRKSFSDVMLRMPNKQLSKFAGWFIVKCLEIENDQTTRRMKLDGFVKEDQRD
jgi:hypothetical protein